MTEGDVMPLAMIDALWADDADETANTRMFANRLHDATVPAPVSTKHAVAVAVWGREARAFR